MSSCLPKSIVVIGQELAVSWSDGRENYLPLQKLRKACPCALCMGEPDVMGEVAVPEKKWAPESFQLQSYQFVGGYALQFFWSDGHSAGIYSFSYLRELITSE